MYKNKMPTSQFFINYMPEELDQNQSQIKPQTSGSDHDKHETGANRALGTIYIKTDASDAFVQEDLEAPIMDIGAIKIGNSRFFLERSKSMGEHLKIMRVCNQKIHKLKSEALEVKCPQIMARIYGDLADAYRKMARSKRIIDERVETHLNSRRDEAVRQQQMQTTEEAFSLKHYPCATTL